MKALRLAPPLPGHGQEPDLVTRLNIRDAEPRQGELRFFAAMRDLIRVEGAGRGVLVVCIGTPLNAGDSLGPMTGTFLERSLSPWRNGARPFEVMGTLIDPIHATNLADRAPAFERPDRLVIAVDASVGTPGEITVKRGPLRPGAGVGRELPPVGDVQILCSISPLMMGFWCANMGDVLQMSELVSRTLLRASLSARQAAV